MSTFNEVIESKVERLKISKDNFIDSVNIFYHDPNNNDSRFFIMSPVRCIWGKKRDDHDFYQITLKEEFSEFIEYFNLVESKFPDKIRNEVLKTNKIVNRWIEKIGNAPAGNNQTAKSEFSKVLNKYVEWVLKLKEPKQVEEIIYVPDTNCLIANPDIAMYNWDAHKRLIILIPPTVVSELDSLKINHRNDEVRKKAESVIRRFKGFRKQGNILEGVNINRSIILRFEAREPKFGNTLSWLDPENNDDRIINSVISIQVLNIFSNVKLLSTDMNIQNKAEFAGIEYIDIAEKIKSVN